MNAKEQLESAFIAGMEHAQSGEFPKGPQAPDFETWFAAIYAPIRLTPTLTLDPADWPDDPELWGDK